MTRWVVPFHCTGTGKDLVESTKDKVLLSIAVAPQQGSSHQMKEQGV